MTAELKQVGLHTITERQNYRQEYDQQFVESVASDMSEHGYKVEYPMVVYPDGGQYVIIDGHTRYRAALLASTYGLKSHQPNLIVWVAVKPRPSDAEFKLQQLAANEQRRDPDAISQAVGYSQAISAGATVQDVAQATGHGQAYVEKRLRLLTLTVEAQRMVASRHLSIDFADELTQLKPEYQCAALAAYTRASRCDLATFKEIVADLYSKQVQAENEQLPLFGGNLEQFIAQTVEAIETKRQKTRQQLEAELDAERRARQADRQYAVRKYTAAQAEIARLRAELAAAPRKAA